jgi:hypothetical protein
MRTTFKNIGLALLAIIAFASCTPNENVSTTTAKIQNMVPENGKSFSADEALQPITFRWTPLVPKPRETVTYRLRVWQLMQGQNGTTAMRSNQPKITKDVTDISEITITGLYTGPCKPPYLCDFIWSVEAISQVDGSITSTTISNPTVFNF